MTVLAFEVEWDRCSGWLQAALDRGPPTHTLDDVKAEVMAGRARLWTGRHSAAVTQIETYPLCKALSVWLAGGDLAELRDEMLPRAESFARGQGCRFVAITGRPGWVKALGYQPVHRTCAKEL